MKGVTKCGLLFLFFIIFGLSLSVSSDTNAITFTMELEPTGFEITNPDSKCLYGGDTRWTNNTGTDTKWICNNPPSGFNGDINSIQTLNNYHFEEGNYYQVQMVLRNNDNNAVIPNPIYWNFYNNDDFSTVGLEVFYEDDRLVQHNCTTVVNDNTIREIKCLESAKTYNQIMNFTVRAKRTGDFPFRIGTDTAVLIRGNYILAQQNQYIYTFGLRKIVEFKAAGLSEMNRKDEEDRSNLESQSSSIDSDADSSSSDAESTGTTLLGAFSGFVSALTSASPSNCVFNMDLGRLDMGNVDLCQLSPPTGFQAVGSVLLILFCVPLSIATGRKVISLFRSFQ